MEHKLTQARWKKRLFGLWRFAAASAEDRPQLHHWQSLTVDDKVFGDNDLRIFLTSVVTFKSHVEFRRQMKLQRQDASHPLHHKELSMIIPPSLVKLWQLCLAVTHSQSRAGEYMFYYGEEQSRLLISDGLKAESDHRQLIKELSKYKGVKYYTYLCRVAEKYKQKPGSVECLKD